MSSACTSTVTCNRKQIVEFCDINFTLTVNLFKSDATYGLCEYLEFANLTTTVITGQWALVSVAVTEQLYSLPDGSTGMTSGSYRKSRLLNEKDEKHNN